MKKLIVLMGLLLILPILASASKINNVIYKNNTLVIDGKGPFTYEAYPLNNLSLIFIKDASLSAPVDLQGDGTVIGSIKVRDLSSDTEKKVLILLYNKKVVHYTFDNNKIHILEGPEVYEAQPDKIKKLADERYTNVVYSFGEELFSHEIYDEATLIYDDIYKKAYYVPLSIINAIRMELGQSPVKTGEELAKAEQPATKTEEVVTEEQPATKTEEVATEEQPVTTTEEVVTEEQPATTTEEVVTEEQPATTTEEVVTEEQPATTTEEVVTEEQPATTTEEVVTEEQPAATTEEVVNEEQPTATTEEVATEEQPATTTEEVVSEEQPTATTEEVAKEKQPAATTEEVAKEKQPAATTEEVAKEKQPAATTEEVVTEEQKPATTEEVAAKPKQEQPVKELNHISDIQIIQEAEVTKLKIVSDKKLMYEFSKNDKSGSAEIKVYNADYTGTLPKKIGYILALTGSKYNDNYIIDMAYNKTSEFSIFPIENIIECDISKPAEQKGVSGKYVQLAGSTQKKELKSRTLVEKKQYRGYKRISLHLSNASFDSVLRLISMETKVNIYHDPGVSGKISIDVDNQPWEPTLDVILKNYEYTYEWEGTKTIRITDFNTLQKEKDQMKKIMKSKESVLPLITRIYQLGFAKASSIAALLVSPLISDRGKVDYNTRSNILIVKDIKKKLDKLDKIIGELDEQTRQVNILVRIYRLNEIDSNNLGINWNFDNSSSSSSSSTPLGGGVNLGSTSGTSISGQNYGMVSLFSANQMLNVEAALSALMNKNKVKLETYPNITVLNHQKANIVIGQKVPITMLDQAGNTITQLTTIGTKIEVTPHINANGEILLKIHPELSNLAGVVAGLVNIATSEADTTMLVKNGETAVIGGLVEYRKTHTNAFIPILGKIPLIGLLFKNKAEALNKGEIIIFVTPKIIE